MIGTTIGHYRIEEKLGAGGMGVVYKAEDMALRRPVALKFLPPDTSDDEERRARFHREARLAAALNHPNICTVYEVGTAEPTGAAGDAAVAPGTPFIAMEYVDGEMLSARLARERRLPIRDLLDVAVQIAAALAEAHANRIVHRDLKPQNVMIATGGRVKVLDFGLAKPLPAIRHQESLISTAEMISADLGAGSIVGTVAYMSPEQALGKPLDARSDIFTFGIILYELVTGTQPFRADTATATLARILEADPEPPPDGTSDVPSGLWRTIRRCLRKKPDDRYETTVDLLRDLEELRARAVAVPVPVMQRRTVARVAAALLLAIPIGYLASLPLRRTPAAPASNDAASVVTAIPGHSQSQPASEAPAAVPPVAPPERPAETTAATAPKTAAVSSVSSVRTAPPSPAPASVVESGRAGATELVLGSSPRASVVVDGSLVGVSPISVPVKPGLHDIVMTSADGLRWRGRVEVAAGEQKNVERDLGARGSLTINADTWVEISLDGGALEQTPIDIPQVAAGLHEVRASRAGYVSQVVEVNVAEGRTTHLQLKLEKRP